MVGRRLTPALRGAGLEVRALVREPADAEGLPAGVEPVVGDVLDPGVVELAHGSDVIVHTASAVPDRRPAPSEAWARNDRIRRQGTRNLVNAAREVGAQMLLESVTLLYADAGERWIDASNARLRPSENLVSMVEAERMAEGSGITSLILRQGLLFGSDAGASRDLLDAVRRQSLPPISDQQVWLPLLDPGDFAAMAVSALDQGLTGTYDTVSDVATINELIERAAALSSVEPPEPVPLEEARAALGPALFATWYRSRRVTSSALEAHGITGTRSWQQMLDSADTHAASSS